MQLIAYVKAISYTRVRRSKLWSVYFLFLALTMSLGYAILATLADQDCSGYDLAKQFDASVGYFWSATHQQIYRELGQLERKGWVVGQAVAQQDRPNKKVFSLTAAGREALQQWMGEPSQRSKHKESLLVKLFAGKLMSPAVLCAELERSRLAHQQQLAVYRQIEADYFDPAPQDYAILCQYLTLRQGISYEENWVTWCEETIAALSPFLADDESGLS